MRLASEMTEFRAGRCRDIRGLRRQEEEEVELGWTNASTSLRFILLDVAFTETCHKMCSCAVPCRI